METANTNKIIAIALVIIILGGTALAFYYLSSAKSSSENIVTTPKIWTNFNLDEFNQKRNEIREELNNLNPHGEFPIYINQAELGKDDPFR